MKNWREKKVFEFFYFIWIEGILFPCLRTLLRDQIHRSSLPKNVLFLLVDFKFENGVWRIERGLKGMRLWKEWGWISHLQKKSNMIIFIEIWLRKWKRKIQWDFDPKVYCEKDLGEVCSYFLENWFFLSLKPKHTSKHTILNIHLNMHILAISKREVCACVGACVGVHH